MIPITLYIILAVVFVLLVGTGVVLLTFRVFRWPLKFVIVALFFGGLVPAGVTAGIIFTIHTNCYVINEDESVDHYLVFWGKSYKSVKGQEIAFPEHTEGTMVINETSSAYLVKELVYGYSMHIPFPEVLVLPNGYKTTTNKIVIDYFPGEAPPESVNSKTGTTNMVWLKKLSEVEFKLLQEEGKL